MSWPKRWWGQRWYNRSWLAAHSSAQYSKEWRHCARGRAVQLGPRSFGLLLSNGGPIWLAHTSNELGWTAGFDARCRPSTSLPDTQGSLGRERMVASSVIVTQSHSVKTTTFTFQLTPTHPPCAHLLRESFFPFEIGNLNVYLVSQTISLLQLLV